MSTLALDARSRRDGALGPLPWRRMAWVIWRQHRVGLVGLAAGLGALALALWLIGVPLHRAYADAAACRPQGSSVCAGLASNFAGMDRLLSNGYVLQAVPALVGAFLGAPLLARELETGTFRYAWTQGLGRRRWTLAKLLVLGVVVVLAASIFGLVLSWYYRPYFATGDRDLSFFAISPLSGGLFGLRGVALPAWTLAAFAIGCLAGTLIRRVVPAILATLAAYTALALAAGLLLRRHYLTPLVTSRFQLVEGPKVDPLGTNLVVGQTYARGGRSVAQPAIEQVLRAAPTGNPEKGFDPTAYLLQHGYTIWTHYQPASRFWAFQSIEGGWLLALSLLLLAATAWLVRRCA